MATYTPAQLGRPRRVVLLFGRPVSTLGAALWAALAEDAALLEGDNKQIAALLGVRPESASRAFAELERAGLLVRTYTDSSAGRRRSVRLLGGASVPAACGPRKPRRRVKPFKVSDLCRNSQEEY
ncbi:MAG TPA: helix-turn-helix domain-containing protein [Roseiflexaceae bacterium]|nr:helix-turn-helix domain-containing protein [Roseiflexaceae bacterium]